MNGKRRSVYPSLFQLINKNVNKTSQEEKKTTGDSWTPRQTANP